MNNQTCDCTAERAMIAALEAENRQLKEQLERAKKQIERLKKIIRWVIAQLQGLAGFLNWALKTANKILRKKSGVAPRVWGFAKGAKWVAERALGMVGGIIIKLEMLMMGE